MDVLFKKSCLKCLLFKNNIVNYVLSTHQLSESRSNSLGSSFEIKLPATLTLVRDNLFYSNTCNCKK